jgi:FkbM family methyltransferase
MSQLPWFRHPFMYYRYKWLYHKTKYFVAPQGTVIKEINGVKFPCDFSLGKRMKSIYVDSYQFEVTSIMKKILKPGGIFIDVGANIGYISAVGAALVGKTGQVHSFEPVSSYFDYAKNFAELNPEYPITVNNYALGEKNDLCRMAKSVSIGGSSIVPGFVTKENTMGTLENVKVKRLDEYIGEKRLYHVSLIKIDTEGFELPVLLGASGLFEERARKGDLPVVIAEITPCAFELMDRELGELDEFMSGYGYKSYDICGICPVNIKKLTEHHADVLFRA